jgi:hypothetical protein
MIAGCIGRDMMANLIGGVVFMVPMMIPAVAVLFPGSASPWVQVLPTYALAWVPARRWSCTGCWCRSC